MDDEAGDHGRRAGSVVGHSAHKALVRRRLDIRHARHGHAGLAVHVAGAPAFDAFQRRLSKLDPVAARNAVLRLDDGLLAEGMLTLVDPAARCHRAKVGRSSHGVHRVSRCRRIGTRSADGHGRLGVRKLPRRFNQVCKKRESLWGNGVVVVIWLKLTMRRSVRDNARLAATSFPDVLGRDRIVIASLPLSLNDRGGRNGTSFRHCHGRRGDEALVPGYVQLILFREEKN